MVAVGICQAYRGLKIDKASSRKYCEATSFADPIDGFICIQSRRRRTGASLAGECGVAVFQ